ncbi:MAG: hypothetical protein K2L56_08455 [Prevotella sp.]|nr:hypothetical protein [Prevotella sp.]
MKNHSHLTMYPAERMPVTSGIGRVGQGCGYVVMLKCCRGIVEVAIDAAKEIAGHHPLAPVAMTIVPFDNSCHGGIGGEWNEGFVEGFGLQKTVAHEKRLGKTVRGGTDGG